MELGKFNELEIKRETGNGIYLIDEEGKEVLLPNKYVDPELVPGDKMKVFVYADSEDRPVATTEIPLLTRGSFAYLEVIATMEYGAFLNWGLEKDLFVPFKEQYTKMRSGQRYVVFLYQDFSTERLCGSSKLNKFFSEEVGDLQVGEEVDLLVYKDSDLGYGVIVNDSFNGLVYHSEVFGKIEIGESLKGFVKKVREDKKLDISLSKLGHKRHDDNGSMILEKVKEMGGTCSLHDKSDPADIYATFGMSKKAFKAAIGGLYKAGIIELDKEGFKLR